MMKLLCIQNNRILGLQKRILKYPRIVSLIIGFLLTVGFLLYNNGGENLYGDCIGYNAMAEEFIKEGLGNFKITFEFESETGALNYFYLRGYGWPFIIAIMKILGFQTHIGWCVWWAAFIVLGLVYCLPELISKIFKKEISIWKRLIPLILTMIIWPGLIIYPLSDLPALIIIIGALLLLYKAVAMNGILKYIAIGICGGLLGLSYYVRTGSIISIFIALIILILNEKSKAYKWIHKVSFIALFFIGVIISTVPQVIINTYSIGVFTYKVPITFTSNVSMVESQWRLGVNLLRFEVNASSDYPYNVARAIDDTADVIFAQEELARDGITFQELLFSILKYPVEFIGIYATKFANIIDARYGEVYVLDWLKNRYFIILSNFILWFLGTTGIIYQWRGYYKIENEGWKNELHFFSDHSEQLLYIFAILGPALVHLVGTHVEPRYFYPGYILLWCYIFIVCEWNKYIQHIKRHIFSMLVIFLCMFGCVSSMWNFTFGKIPYHSYFIQERPYVLEEISDGGIFKDTDSEGIEGETSEFVYNVDERKLFIDGYCILQGENSNQINKKLVLANENKQYVFDLKSIQRKDVVEMHDGDERYEYSGFNFTAFLFDMDSGDYHVYIVLDNDISSKVFDTEQIISVNKS